MTTMTRRAAAPRIASERPDGWQEQSACRQVDAELFYPLGGEGGRNRTGANLDQEIAAKRVCGGCPVRAQCRTWALEIGDEWGIWGGLNERERRALRDPKPELSAGRRHALERSAQVRAEKAASRTYCSEGHEMTPENTVVDRTYRVCRTCRALKQREYRLRQAVGSDA